jgi:RNA polymerase sigma-70 factor (ECF subfamily)
MDDGQLIETYYGGDDQAFDELYQRHVPKLIAHLKATYRLRYEDAEDIAQSALLRVAGTRERRASRYDPTRGAAFWTWLQFIADNLAKSFLRSRRDPRTGRPKFQTVSTEEEQPVFGAKPGMEPDPVDDASLRELRGAIEDCQNELPPDQRNIMVLHRQGKSNEEMAKELQIPYGTVGQRLHGARHRMQVCLEAKGFDRGSQAT